MPIHADTILLEAARRIVPVIREHAEEAERETHHGQRVRQRS
jgi:hypothetical protein